MEEIIKIVFNYLWFIIKLILLSAAISLPVIALTYIFKNFYNRLRQKKSFLVSISIIIFIISYVIILLIYFIPLIGNNIELITAGEIILFIFIQILRLAIINLIITGIIIIFAFISSAIYDKLSKNKKKLNFWYLWISFIICFIILFIVILLFPKLPAMINYLIFA
jgi:hypothetical protein